MIDTDVTFSLPNNREIAVTDQGIIFYRRDGKSSVFLGRDLDALREAVALADEKGAAWKARNGF